MFMNSDKISRAAHVNVSVMSFCIQLFRRMHPYEFFINILILPLQLLIFRNILKLRKD